MVAGSPPLLASTDRGVQRAVEQAFARAGLALPETCADAGELERRLRARPTELALVDITGDPLKELHLLATLLARHPQTQVVLLCPSLERELLLEAMQMGVRHCVDKSELASELGRLLLRIGRVSERDGHRLPGRVVTVMPARGGSGASTLAINLAQELLATSGGPVLLVDADVHYGSIATYLSLKARYGLSDILAAGAAVDGPLLTTTAALHPEGLSVLVSPVSIDFEAPTPLVLQGFPHMLRVVGDHYRWTIIDLPRCDLHTTAEVARHSELTLIVLQLTVHDVRAARALRQALERDGVDPRTIMMVANRYRRRGEMLGLEDARRALAGAELATLSNDYESAVRAINLGQALAKVAPRSPLRRDIRELAVRLSDGVQARRAG